ncbi:L-threonylcarbamoyladenylate synthase [Amnibacterium endophyticum]|uniref:L-threonylcarbamoyladenylate synthase n=1 Tax=Amnibacterium endophyticum TaxID=2109337 RepID=A0ABW4LEG2_9MICO
MATVVDCTDPVTLLPGMREARAAIARGDLVVMPTDTVYGIAADAFQPAAVQALLDAKGRGRQAPPPVLVPNRSTLDALAEQVPEAVNRLADAFWPGALTIVLPARATLVWDLGETGGTVALRMPDDRIALELLAETGPLAVSSANLTGQPAATTAQDALGMLGDAVDVYLDAGSTPGALPSTIIDATGLVDGTGPLVVLREGAILAEALQAVVPEAFIAAEPEPESQDEPEPQDETAVPDDPAADDERPRGAG